MLRVAHCRPAAQLAMAGRFILAGGICLFVLTSCSQKQSRQEPAVRAPTARPVLHAVYAEELRAAMRDLNAQANQQVWLQMYNVTQPQVDMREMVAVAEKMADVAANRLPQAVEGVEMSTHEREVFLGLARRLHDQAVLLGQQAEADQLVGAQSTMNEIINTCNTCHTMFRSVAGPI